MISEVVQYRSMIHVDSAFHCGLILGITDSCRQNCSFVMLGQLLVRLVEDNLNLTALLNARFQIVTLDNPGDTAKVFVGIHMGSSPEASWFMEKKVSA